jgi:predicted dehydrogenase
MLKVGMIGAGWVTQYHLPGWQARPDARVVAICDPDIAAARARAEAFGIPGVYDSADAMLTGEALDCLDVCSPRESHPADVRRGLAHGLAVLCQKPLAPTLPEAERLVAEAGNARLMVHENWRFRPYYRRLREWLGEGVVGPVRAVRLEFHSSGMLPDETGARPALVRQPFFRALERLLVMEVLIHHIDTLRFLLGELDLESARLSRSNDEIIGEDVAILRLRRRADGVPVDIWGNLAVHGAPPAPVDRLSIYAEAATAQLDGTDLRLMGRQERTERFDPATSYQAAYSGAIAHFLDCLRDGSPFETNPADNLETLRIVEAAYATSGFQARRQS